MSDLTNSMLRSEVNNVFQKLKGNLSKPIWELADKLLQLLNDQGRANCAKVHQALFPIAETRAASAQLTKLLQTLVKTATDQGLALDYAYEGEKSKGTQHRSLFFVGPSITMAADAEGLRGIPDQQIITGQEALLLYEPPKVLIVTFNENEFNAVKARFQTSVLKTPLNIDDCLVDDLGVHGGMRVIHQFSQQGEDNAQESITRANNAYKPHYVVACGVAFGVDNQKQAIGDVLVSKYIVPYELARVAHGELELRESQPPADARLFDAIVQLDMREKDGGLWPKLRMGGLLTGNKLIDDAGFRDKLRLLAGSHRIIGGEMEAEGIHVALRRTRTPWIIIKAICDWADGNKDNPNKERDQKLAAANAAQVTKALIDTGWLTPPLSSDSLAPSATGTPPSKNSTSLAKASHILDIASVQKHYAENQFGTEANVDNLKSLTAAQATFDEDATTYTPRDADKVIALDHILEWVNDPKEREFFALLGETGMGKTTTVQRLVKQLDQARAQNQDVPQALYFDLRKVDVKAFQSPANVPSRDEVPLSIGERTIAECVRNGWMAVAGRLPTVQDVLNAIDQGALVVYDGLDEVVSRIGDSEGLTFTQGLLRTLEESRQRRGGDAAAPQRHPSKLIITCRTQYFRSLAEQNAHILGEHRGANAPDKFRALGLLPLTDEQIHQYLRAVLSEEEATALIGHIHSIHNLRELAGRPFTLTLVQQFLPQIETWQQTGQTITGARLYQQVARHWLMRDKQKQLLRLEDKETLAAELAHWYCTSQVRGVTAKALEDWVDQWVYAQGAHSRYAQVSRELVYDDVRNATFLKRVDNAADPSQSRFEFAHTSLYEFFLALRLHQALQNDQRQQWVLGQVSPETLTFFGQLLAADPDKNRLLATLGQWRTSALAGASQLQLAYAVLAYQTGLPLPVTAGFDLIGLDLSAQTIGCAQEPVGPAQGPRFDLRDAKLNQAHLSRTRFWACDLQGAVLDEADLAQAEMLACTLDTTNTGLLPRLIQRGVAVQPFAAAAPGTLTPTAPPPRSTSAGAVISYGHHGLITACAFSPDGLSLASASYDNSLRLWDARSGALLRVFEGHSSSVSSCAFSPDGLSLASASYDNSLRLWDARSGALLRVFEGHSSSVSSCAFSPDGLSLASASHDQSLRLWDARSGALLRVFEGHSSSVSSCAFSPDGLSLASASHDQSLRLWDARSGALLRVFEGHSSWVSSCAFSPDGLSLASASHDQSLRLWDARSGALLRVFEGHSSSVSSCAFSPDGLSLASASHDQSLRLWDARSGALLRVFEGHSSSVSSCAFSPDGLSLASASHDQSLRLWDARSGALLRVFEGHSSSVSSCAFSPDGLSLASASGDQSLRLWDARSGALLRVFEGHSSSVSSCAFSPDGLSLASASYDNSLRLWDARSGALLRVFEGHSSSVSSCAFSPDGLSLASASHDQSLRLWDARSGALLRVFEGHSSSVSSCAFSPDGLSLASASDDKSLRLWDARSGALLRVFEGHSSSVSSCAFSPDGLSLASASHDQSLRLWDARSGALLRVFEGHSSSVSSCAFSPDGLSLASASHDQSLRLWDARSGALLRVFEGHSSSVSSCAFSPDGLSLASASGDQSLRLWDARQGELIRSHLHADQAAAAWPAQGDLLYSTGRAWRTLRYQYPDAQGALQVAPIENCQAWQGA